MRSHAGAEVEREAHADRFKPPSSDPRAVSSTSVQWLMIVRALVWIAVLAVAGPTHADPTSLRITALGTAVNAKQAGAEAEFWRLLDIEGTPIVEPGERDSDRLVTFVWHGTTKTRNVVLWGPLPPYGSVADHQLRRVAGTDVFARTLVISDSARFSYRFTVDDDFKPITVEPRDDKERNDPHGRRSEAMNASFCELPNAPPAIVPHRATPPGTVSSFDVTSGGRPAGGGSGCRLFDREFRTNRRSRTGVAFSPALRSSGRPHSKRS